MPDPFDEEEADAPASGAGPRAPQAALSDDALWLQRQSYSGLYGEPPPEPAEGAAGPVTPELLISPDAPVADDTAVPPAPTNKGWVASGMSRPFAEEQAGSEPSLLEPWPDATLSPMRFKITRQAGRVSTWASSFELLDTANNEVLLKADKQVDGNYCIQPGGSPDGTSDACLATLSWNLLGSNFTLTHKSGLLTKQVLGRMGLKMSPGRGARRYEVTLTNVIDGSSVRYVNKRPIYNAERDVYNLDFCGRATKASVKNFVLIPEDDKQALFRRRGCEDAAVLFGKTAAHEFRLDLKAPVSLVQAFGLALSSLVPKLAVQ